MKLTPFVVTTLLLCSCVEFTGERGQIGFSSNLTLGSETWTPDSPIANGSVAIFKVEQLLEDTTRETSSLDLTGTTRGSIRTEWSEGLTIAVTGSDSRGRVVFDGEARDHFSAAFRQADRAVFTDHSAALLHLDRFYPESFALVQGSTLHPAVTLESRRGQSLGYLPEHLVLVGGDSLQSFTGADHAYELVADSLGEDTVVAHYSGEAIPAHTIHVVEVSEITSISVEALIVEYGDDDLPVIYAQTIGKTADGLEVYGLPIEYQWSNPGHELWTNDGTLLVDLSNNTSETGQLNARFGDHATQVDFDLSEVTATPG